ncbi:TIGR00730 family Rossman fold protein [Streptococcus thermophilus]|uniref:LOG family protein n=1 Tax=Streptococcus thermophilus TaxID=1308 RepID=UPI003A7F6BDE
MNIAVYCGVSLGNNLAYENVAVELGKWIAANNNSLIYGDGNVGLMGILADTVIDSGSKVIGIMPTFLQERELAHDKLDSLEIVENMPLRKQRMLKLYDVCLAIPGGPGTLEEIAEAYSWIRVGQSSSPCIFLNINSYYDLLEQFFDKMVEEGFLSLVDRKALKFVSGIDELDQLIKSYKNI